MKKSLFVLVVLFYVASAVFAGGNTDGAVTSDVTLSVWHWKVAFDPGFIAVADAFKERTGISLVTEVTTPDDAYRQKLTAAAVAGNLPDIYAYWAGPANGAYDGVALEWTSRLNEDPAWQKSFFPAALSGVTIAKANIDTWAADENASAWTKAREPGQIYGIPIDVGAFYTIYGNGALMKQAGVPTDRPPATMEVWMEDMNKIKKATNIPGFVFSAQTFSLYENWFANFMDYMRNGPEEFTRLMNREAKMSDPAHIHIAKFLEDLTKSGNILPGSVTLGIDPADQAFAQGRAAYLLGGTFTYANLQAMGMNVDDIVSFRVPAYEGSEVPDATVTPFPLVTLNVNSKGEHVAESVEFTKFMTSTQGMTLYANNAFDIPSVSMEDMSDLNPAIRSMLSSLSTESNWWSENTAISGKVFSNAEWQVFAEGKQRILLGEATAMEVAKSFDEAAEIEKQRASK